MRSRGDLGLVRNELFLLKGLDDPNHVDPKGEFFFHAHDLSRISLPLSVIARSVSDEAIQLSACAGMDCIAEPVIGRRFAPTRWLAMTTALAVALASLERFSEGRSVKTAAVRPAT